MNTEEAIKNIKSDLRLSMNGVTSAKMRHEGYNYRINFGVELPRLKNIASKYNKSHQLAQSLWNENIRECKILSTLLQPTEQFYEDLADLWISEIDNIEIAQYCCMNIFQHLSYIKNKIFEWISSDKEFYQTCGYLTFSRIIANDSIKITERECMEFINQSLTDIHSNLYNVRTSCFIAIEKFIKKEIKYLNMMYSSVKKMNNSNKEVEIYLYNIVKEEIDYNNCKD